MLKALKHNFYIFSHLKLRIATAIHIFKWQKMIWIYEIEVMIYGRMTDVAFTSLNP